MFGVIGLWGFRVFGFGVQGSGFELHRPEGKNGLRCHGCIDQAIATVQVSNVIQQNPLALEPARHRKAIAIPLNLKP